jgi:hypothetical protein
MFLKGRCCSECGSTLVCQAEGHKQPHCFVCGFNHPAIEFHMRGPVWQLIHRIELDGKKFGMKVQLMCPGVVFIDGYAYQARTLIGPPETWKEVSEETRKVRGYGENR